MGVEYDVDMSKFFELVSNDVDKTIFDDCGGLPVGTISVNSCMVAFHSSSP